MREKWWIRVWTPLAVLITIAALWYTADWFNEEVFRPSLTNPTHGFGAYYSASRLLADGQLTADIYNPHYFRPLVLQESQGRVEDIYNANPPTTALLFWPLASLTLDEARPLWSRLNLLFLVGGIGLLMWGLGVRLSDYRRWPILGLALSFSLLFQPTVQNFMLGQAYGFIFLLLSAATAAFFKSQPVGGIALALSLLLKTAGWPLLLLLLWLRRGRYLAWVIGSAVVIVLMTLPLFPPQMWLAFGRLLFAVGRSPLVCVPAYQTTRSWLCHLFAPEVRWHEAETAGIAIPAGATAVYFLLALLTMGLLLLLARKRPNAAFIATICWSVLFLPLGEAHHHLVMLIPFVWAIVRGDKSSRLSQLLVILSAYFYLLEFKANDPTIQSGYKALFAYPYLAGAWLLFLSILWENKSAIAIRPKREFNLNWPGDRLVKNAIRFYSNLFM